MLAILERIKAIVAAKLAAAKALIETYTPLSDNVPEPAQDNVPGDVVTPQPDTPAADNKKGGV
jgi:hypothetical protein